MVAVTGSAGFIGRHLVAALKDRGEDVLEIDQKVGRDLLMTGLATYLEDVEVVYHLAARPGVRESFGWGLAAYLTANVLATELLLEGAAEAGVRRVVFASSSSVYSSAAKPVSEDTELAPASPYGVTKLAGEHLCRISPVDCVCLRYFTVYGPGQRPDMAFSRFIAAARAGEPLTVYGDGHQVRNFTFVEDVVAATITAADQGSGTYNIAGGSEASIREVLGLLGKIAGAELDIDYGPAVVGDVRRTSADISRARHDLDYAPQVQLEEGLRRQWLSP